MHLSSVGLGFSPKGASVVVAGPLFSFRQPFAVYFLKIPKNADPLPLIEA